MENLMKELGESILEKLEYKILQHSLDQEFGYYIEYNDDYFVLQYNKVNIEPNEMGIPSVGIECDLIIKNKKFKYNRVYCAGEYEQYQIESYLNKRKEKYGI